MKKTIVNVSFEDQKLFAAKLYMEQKGLSFEDEMSKAADCAIWEICSGKCAGIS